MVVLKIICIFALWIDGSSYPSTRGMSIAPSTFLTIDFNKRIDTMRKKPLVQLLQEFKQKHGDEYAYDMISEMAYKNESTKIPIVCKKHGVFWQRASAHLHGKRCPLCAIEENTNKSRLSRSEVIKRMAAVHHNFYDYSKFVYKRMHDKGIIICPIHGEFLQAAHEHIEGAECPKCSKKAKWTTESFLDAAHKKFGNKFKYIGKVSRAKSRIKVICPKHGAFISTASNHLATKFGCAQCAFEKNGEAQTHSWQMFVNKAKAKWGGTYDYSLINEQTYTNTKEKVPIKCPKHGVFLQTPNNHLNGVGCPRCLRSLGEERVELFLKAANEAYVMQHKLLNTNKLCGNKYFRLDFFLPDKNIAIEYNGQQHYTEVLPFVKARSFKQQQARDESLRMQCKVCGIKLIEISYNDFENIEKILYEQLKK